MDKLTQRVLAWANRQRAKDGREPLKDLPRGQRCLAAHCPVAKAIVSGSVSYDRVPEYVADWMFEFDTGLDYHEYLRY